MYIRMISPYIFLQATFAFYILISCAMFENQIENIYLLCAKVFQVRNYVTTNGDAAASLG